MRMPPRPDLLAATAVLLVTLTHAVQTAEGIPVREPSPNAQRLGTYQAETGIADYHYWVYVPKSYAKANDAGISLFFHGQNSQRGAANFPGTLIQMLERHRLIGINMQYMDGNNTKDTNGKVDAAIIALGQIMADYRVLPGRGNISCFSGGGHPSSLLMQRLARRSAGARIGRDWPFCQASIYGTNFSDYKGDYADLITMNWQFCLGEKEWNLYQFGPRLTAISAALLHAPHTSRDINLKMTIDKGHTITADDLAASAAMFERSDIMHAPFIPEHGLADDTGLAACRDAARERNLQEAITRATRVADDRTASSTVRRQAKAIVSLINERADVMVGLVTHLSKTDPVLATYYVSEALRQVQGLEQPTKRLERLRDALLNAKPVVTANAAAEQWIQRYPDLIGGNGLLKPEHRPWVESIIASSIPGSSIHTWASEYLAMTR